MKKHNALAYGAFVLLGLYLTVYQALTAPMTAEFGMNTAAMGVLVALHFVGSLLAPPVLGRLADRVGCKKVLLLSVGLMVAGLMLLWQSRSAFMVCLAIALNGCGYAATEGLFTGFLQSVNGDDGVRIINRSQMFYCLGAVAGPLLAGLFAHAWRNCFGILLAVFLVLWVLLIFRKMAVPAPAQEEAPSSGRPLFLRPMLLVLCLAMAFYLAVEDGVAFFMGKFFAEGSFASLASWALSGYWLAMMVGRLLGSLLRSKHLLISIWGMLVAIGAQVALLLTGPGMGAVVLFAATGFFISVTWPTLASLAGQLYPACSGEATGAMMTAGSIGGSLGSVALGALGESLGVSGALWLMPALLLGTALLSVTVLRRRWSI